MPIFIGMLKRNHLTLCYIYRWLGHSLPCIMLQVSRKKNSQQMDLVLQTSLK